MGWPLLVIELTRRQQRPALKKKTVTEDGDRRPEEGWPVLVKELITKIAPASQEEEEDDVTEERKRAGRC